MPDALRVCFLIRSLEQGGAERQLTEILTGLDTRTFEPTVLVFYPGGPFWPHVAAIPGVRLVSLDKRGRWDLVPFLFRLWRELRRDRPHVIHGCLSIANELALVAGRLSGSRVVWWLGAAYMDLAMYDWLSRASFRVSAFLSRWPDLIVINSQEGRRHHERCGYATDRMIVVPNGFDVARFRPDPDARAALRREWGVSPDQPLIGLVARLDPIKDHATFLRAAATLARTNPDVRFVCVGGGPAAYAATLRQLSDSLGLTARVIWAGARDDVERVYNAFDVATLCSRGEGLPNAVGEAMASGVTCVVTDVGDTRSLVGDTGIVVPAEDPDRLARGWQSLLALDAEARRALGERARARVASSFDRDRLIRGTADALLAACGRGTSRITLVIASLAAGGAERVATRLANDWVCRGHEVSVLTLAPTAAAPFFPLEPRVTVRGLDLARESATRLQTLVASLQRVRRLRSAIRETAPTVVVSFLDTTNVMVLLATRGLGLPVVVSERSSFANPETRRLTRALRNVTYPWASAVVVQTEAARRELPPRLRRRAVVVPNPVEAPAPQSRQSSSAGAARFVAVGRLVYAKGFDLLLEAFAHVLSACPGATLTIVGDGPDRADLEARRARLALGAAVRFVGEAADVSRYVRDSDVFVLSSRYEGFPNALCEAMALGVAPVAFDCACGPSEIIRDGTDGVLVPPGDVWKLADAMIRLATDVERRERLAERAPEVVARFSPDKVGAMWERLIGRRRPQADP